MLPCAMGMASEGQGQARQYSIKKALAVPNCLQRGKGQEQLMALRLTVLCLVANGHYYRRHAHVGDELRPLVYTQLVRSISNSCEIRAIWLTLISAARCST